MNVNELAEQLDLSPRRVQQLAKAGVFEKTERGEYDLLRCALSYIYFLRRHSASHAGLPCSLDEIARVIGYTRASVNLLERHGVLVKVSHGEYDMIESVKNFVQYSIQKSRQGRPASADRQQIKAYPGALLHNREDAHTQEQRDE